MDSGIYVLNFAIIVLMNKSAIRANRTRHGHSFNQGGGILGKTPPLGPKKTLEKIVRFLSAAGKILIVFKRPRQNFDVF